MHELAHEFTSKKISPWGGLKFFQQTYERSGVREDLLSAQLPEGGSNAAYKAIDLVEGLMVSAVLGSRRIAHTGMLRTDEVIAGMFGWKDGMGSQSTFSRFFRKFTTEGNDALFTSLMRKWWDRMAIGKVTIDIDSTVCTRYGEQEGATVGYNPQKKGRASHHPLMAFCDELKMTVNGWMRPGNTNDAGDVESFLAQLLLILPAERIGLVRGDSGFYGDPFMSQLESEGVTYIIRGRLTSALLSRIVRIKEWHHNDTVFKDAQYAELRYKAKDWKKGRRAIVVRRPKKDPDGNPVLFDGEDVHKNYDIAVFFTTSELSASKVHALYNQRGESENRIKELKYDYGMDGFAFKDIAATEAVFRFILMAYNIMALFKQKVMTNSKVPHQLATIRFQCIAIGSYLVKTGRNKVMKLSAEGKRRHFLEHFFDQVEILKPPFRFSTA
jgi:Transposase DDE domain group 1